MVPFRGYRPKMRAGFSDMTRASHHMGSPRLTTPSLYIKDTMVSTPGEPKGTEAPSGVTKMLSQPNF